MTFGKKMIFWLIFLVIFRVRQPMEDDLKNIYFSKKQKKNIIFQHKKKIKYFFFGKHDFGLIFVGHIPRKTTYGRRPTK